MRTVKRAVTWVLLALTACALVVVAGLPVYVFPPSNPAQRADVVFVLGPATFDRIRQARELIDEGFTNTLVVSVSNPESTSTYIRKICDRRQAPEVICVRPIPYTTQGEARVLRSLANEHGWSSAVVITQTPHLVRAKYIIERCFDGRLSMIAIGGPRDLAGWAYEYGYQSLAFAKAALTEDC